MRKILSFLATSLLMAGLARAGGDVAPYSITGVNWTNAAIITNYTAPMQGYLEGIEIVLRSVTPQTNILIIQVVTNQGSQAQTFVFTNTVTANGVYRPRFQTHDNAGLAVAAQTNAYERFLFTGEKLKITAHTPNPNITNAFDVILKLWR